MNPKEIEFDQIEDYIKQEKGKGRSIKEIVKELATVRSDVTVLSHNTEVAERQIAEALKR